MLWWLLLLLLRNDAAKRAVKSSTQLKACIEQSQCESSSPPSGVDDVSPFFFVNFLVLIFVDAFRGGEQACG